MKTSLDWLQDWYQSQCDGDWEHRFGIKIETVDNPGWYVTINLHETDLKEKIFNNISYEDNPNNWYFCLVRDGIFEASCDITKLRFILDIFQRWARNIDPSSKMLEDENLKWVELWFQKQCDGDWEHEFGIKIDTLDNPGWFVVIDLRQTVCQEKKFETINNIIDENNWVQCKVQNYRFEASGGPKNLGNILEIFLNWVKS